MTSHKHCKTCKHGPNKNGHVFSKKGQKGCKRMDGIERVFDTLGDEHKATALQMSAAIVGYLDSKWRGAKSRGCPGWQGGQHLQGTKAP